MKLDEILSEIEKDSVIDETKLDSELFKIPSLQSKWYKIYSTEYALYIKISNELKRKRKEAFEYYTGKASDEVYTKKPLDLKVLRQDVSMYIDTDEEVMKLEERMQLQKYKVDLIEKFLNSLIQRGYNIKTAVEFIRFLNSG